MLGSVTLSSEAVSHAALAHAALAHAALAHAALARAALARATLGHATFGQSPLGHTALPGTTAGWWRQVHHWVPIGFVGAISWSVWLVRFALSRVYRPVPAGYMTTTSVVVPSFREDPDILERCLDSWLADARLREMVCRRILTLAQAQHALEANWYAAWLRYVIAAGHI
jgi:hypothetical protein